MVGRREIFVFGSCAALVTGSLERHTHVLAIH